MFMNKVFNHVLNKLLASEFVLPSNANKDTRKPLHTSDNNYSHFPTNQIHPCIYRGKVTFFYSRFLIINEPDLYKTLQDFANKYKIILKEDKRFSSYPIDVERRKNWISISIIGLGLMFGAQNVLQASDLNKSSGNDSVNTLRIIPSTNNISKSIAIKQSEKAQQKHFNSVNLNQTSKNQVLVREISNILLSHFRSKNAPDYVSGDLRLMAEYYSQFPEAIKLIKSIANKPWSLQFQKNEWVTQVTGTRVSIHSAKILFDTRAAAQLKLRTQCNNNPQCIASPADALLHELLHTQEVFLNSTNFLANGGMNTQLYPTSHEMNIIKSEKVLYKKMEKRDGIKRPQRSKHVGKIRQASCVTCIM